jgi:CBS domain containing-hemolysin-like protein
VCALKRDTTVGDAIVRDDVIRFSRIPIWGDSDDDVSGYVLKDALLLAAAQDQLGRPVRDFQREILVVPSQTMVSGVLQRLLQANEHIALCVNEFGGVVGLVTLEDIVETLLGMEIVDEVDSVEDMRALARNKWYERAEKLGVPREVLESSRPPPPRAD